MPYNMHDKIDIQMKRLLIQSQILITIIDKARIILFILQSN